MNTVESGDMKTANVDIGYSMKQKNVLEGYRRTLQWIAKPPGRKGRPVLFHAGKIFFAAEKNPKRGLDKGPERW